MTTSPPNTKPTFTPPPQSDLLSRLSSFLPQLSAANASLDAEIAADAEAAAQAHSIEHVDDSDERYIEMNLGLGVLEEIHSDSDSDSESDKENDPIARALNATSSGKKPTVEIVSEDEATDQEEEDENNDDESEKKMLETILEASKRHGKGPRGRPSIVEVEETACTPTPEKQAERQ